MYIFFIYLIGYLRHHTPKIVKDIILLSAVMVLT